MNGLIIREPWIGRILSGRKTWEMRTTPTACRGRVGLIRKGTGMVAGIADIVDSLPPLDAAGLAASRECHGIPPELDTDVLGAGWLYPWVLRNIRPLPRPVPAGQKPGQVIWVPLSPAVVVAIDEQYQAPPAPERMPVNSPPASGPRERPASRLQAAESAGTMAPPAPASMCGADGVVVTLTDGAIRNGNLSVRTALHLLPDGVIGGSSRGETASSLLTVVFKPGRNRRNRRARRQDDIAMPRRRCRFLRAVGRPSGGPGSAAPARGRNPERGARTMIAARRRRRIVERNTSAMPGELQ
jgi:hypothetical protein